MFYNFAKELKMEYTKSRRVLKITSFAFILVMVLIALFAEHSISSCDGENSFTVQLLTEEREYIVKDGKSDYTIVFSASDAFQADEDLAKDLSMQISHNYGVTVRSRADISTQESAYEILIGKTDRKISLTIAAEVASLTEDKNLVYIIAESNGKLACVANSVEAYAKAKEEMLALLGKDSFSVTKGLYITFTMTRAEYDKEIADKEAAEKESRLEAIKDKLVAFDDSIFGERTPMPSGVYDLPHTYPTVGQHPRLLLTADMLPDIRRVLEDPLYADLAEDFWTYANMKTDGALPDISTLNVPYNVSDDVLMAIEAKALAYLLTGDEIYGYEAILACKNYMTTLVLHHSLEKDLFLWYSRSMMVMGEVYDWCYPLMTDSDKSQFVRGVQKYLCEDCYCGEHDKITMGFPPVKYNAIQGHGTNCMLQRDYLSFALAIFDEYPDWWELVAGRYYEEFVPASNVFFAAGANTQGTNNYVWNKIHAQLAAAWIIKVATGEVPYDDGIKDICNFMAYQRLPNGKLFQSGDSTATASGASDRLGELIYIVAALYPSEFNQINATLLTNYYTNYRSMTRTSTATPVTFLIYRANGLDYEPESRDFNEGLGLYWYAGTPMGQTVARNSWQSDAAVTFMRVGELSGGNHDHEDSGTFQIYYKGCFTSESGQYGTGAGYGTSHHSYWHQATIAHNGILVFNPAFSQSEPKYSDGELTNAKEYFYSGGQERHTGVSDIDDWINTDKQKTGTVTGVDCAYTPSGALDFAYLAGDISIAYNAATVDTIERRMLTYFTEDEDFPMFFVVYDYVKSQSPEFTKSFLMHTVTEPQIEGNTATYVQNDGKMVLTTLTDDAVITKIGGEGKTYWINGKNLNIAEQASGTGADKGDSDYISDGELWGRIQIDNTGKLVDHLLNVIYVTDATNENTVTPVKIENEQIIGAQILDTVVVYSKTEVKNREEISFETTGTGLKKYYFSGLAEGSWNVKVDGVNVAHTYTSAESGFISFVAPAGNVVLIPGADVRPANSDDIKFYASGGIMPEGTKYFYIHDEEYVLPELKSTKDTVFAGWYANPSSSERIYTIPVGTRGTFKVYARFYRSFNEDYENVNIDLFEQRETVNNFRYLGSGKPLSSYKTVKDTETGNTYLLWNVGEKDSEIDLNFDFASFLGDRTVVTYRIDLARDGDRPAIKSNVRVRGETSKNTATIFSITQEGEVRLGGSSGGKIATLTEDFTTITISLDLLTGKMYAFDENGDVIQERIMTLPAVDAHLTYSEFMYKCKYAIDWYTGVQDPTAALRIDNFSINGGLPENANIPDPTLPNAIIYSGVDSSMLPQGTRYLYTQGTPTTLPETLILANGLQFHGWYEDEALTKKVTQVPADYDGQFVVYPKISLFMEESFDDLEIDVSNPDGAAKAEYSFDINGFSYRVNQKAGAGFKTVTDPRGNTYLLWSGGTKDPQLHVNGCLADVLKGQTSVTYSVTMAKDGNNPVPKTTFRVAESGSKNFTVFSTKPNGDVLLCGKDDLKICTLGSKFQTVTVTVDFAAATATVYNPDGTVATNPETGVPLVATIAKPSSSEAIDLVDFINYTTYIFSWYMPSDSEGKRAIRINDILAAEGKYIPTQKESTNAIYYDGVEESWLPEGFPLNHSSDTETPLPTPISSPEGYTFGGWYADSSYTLKIDSIEPGRSGDVTVFAMWIVECKFDFDDITVDLSNLDDKSDSKTYNLDLQAGNYALSFRTNGKAGASFKTVEDENGGKYLLWSPGTEDPEFFSKGCLKSVIGDDTAVTFTVNLAKAANDISVPKTRFRIYGGHSTKSFTVFTTESNGDVLLAGNKNYVIANIHEEFTTLILSIDFAEGKLIAYNKDGSVITCQDESTDTYEAICTITKPAASEAENLVDFISYTTELFDWYCFSDSSYPSRALKIDDRTIKPGTYRA